MDKLLTKVQRQQNLQKLLMSFELLEHATVLQTQTTSLGLHIQPQSAQIPIPKVLGTSPAAKGLSSPNTSQNISAVADQELQGVSERSLQSSDYEQDDDKASGGMSSWIDEDVDGRDFEEEEEINRRSKINKSNKEKVSNSDRKSLAVDQSKLSGVSRGGSGLKFSQANSKVGKASQNNRYSDVKVTPQNEKEEQVNYQDTDGWMQLPESRKRNTVRVTKGAGKPDQTIDASNQKQPRKTVPHSPRQHESSEKLMEQLTKQQRHDSSENLANLSKFFSQQQKEPKTKTSDLEQMLKQKLLKQMTQRKNRRNSVDLYQTIKNIPLGMIANDNAVMTVDFQKELSRRGISLDVLRSFQQKEVARKSTFYQKKIQKQRNMQLLQEQKLQLDDLKSTIVKMMEQDEDRKKFEMLQQPVDNSILKRDLVNSGFFLTKANLLEQQQMKQSRRKTREFNSDSQAFMSDRPITPTSGGSRAMQEKQQENNRGLSARSLSPEKVKAKKLLMTKKINEMIEKNKQKEEHLLLLKQHLKLQKSINQQLNRDLKSPKYKEIVQKRNDRIQSPELAYRQHGYQTLVDCKELTRPLNFTQLDSIMEIKATLEGKLKLLEQRQDMMDSRTQQFKKMIKTVAADLIKDQKRQNEMQIMIDNVSSQVDDLQHIYRIDADRTLEIDNIYAEYMNKIKKNRSTMEEVLEEKQVALENQEQDTQQVLFRLLLVIERIKSLRKTLNKLEIKKKNNKKLEKEVLSAFLKQKQQVQCINYLQQLNLIKCFQVKIDEIEKEHENDDDQIRLEGLIQITELKKELEQACTGPTFMSEEQGKGIQTSSIVITPRKNENMSAYQQYIQTSLHSLASSKKSGLADSFHSNNSARTDNSHDLEQYIYNQSQYDDFYKLRLQNVGELQIQFIIDRYCMSTIKLNSLQMAHKQREGEKQDKIQIIEGERKKIEEYEAESNQLGKYLEKFDDNFRLHRKDGLHYYPELVGDDADKFDHYQLVIDATKDFPKELLMAKSLEVLKDMLLRQQLRNTQVHTQITQNKDMIRECYSQLELMLRLYFGQILSVKKEMQFEFEMNHSTERILEVLKRYEEASQPKPINVNPKRKSTGTSRTLGKRLTQVKEQSEVAKSDISGGEKSLIIKEYGSENMHRPSLQQDTTMALDSIEGGADKNASPHSSICFMDNEQVRVATQKAIDLDMQKHAEQEKQAFGDLKSLLDLLESVKKDNRGQALRKMHTQGRQLQKTQELKGIGGDEQAVLNQEDFDPVFRKRDFLQVRRYVIDSLDLKRKTKAEILKMKQNPNKGIQPQVEIQDQEQLDFLADDPRKKNKGSDEWKKQQLLQAKLIENQKFQGRDTLWKMQQGEHETLRIELFKQKERFSGIQRQEKEFIIDLKSKLNARYTQIKNDFEREHIQKAGHQSQKQISSLSGKQTVDIDTMKKSSSIANFHTAQRSRRHQAWSICSEKGLKESLQENLVKPITSPCFGSTQKRPMLTASIKERIKLNKMLTTSTKTGKLIGVNPEKPNRIQGLDKLDFDPSQVSLILSGRDNKSSHLQHRVDKYRTHLMTARNSNQFTTNTAFNLTYRTVKMSDHLKLKNVDRWKDRASMSIGSPPVGASTTQSGLASHRGNSSIKLRNPKSSLESQLMEEGAIIDVKHIEAFNKYFNRREKERASQEQRDGHNKSVFAAAHNSLVTIGSINKLNPNGAESQHSRPLLNNVTRRRRETQQI